MEMDREMDVDLLRRLSEAPGVPGREERVRELIRRELEGVVDELREDALGNLIAVRRAADEDAARVMVAAHMDEIGFVVKHVDERGFLRVHNVGGFDPRTLVARQVTVHASRGSGDRVGVLNPTGKPIHTSTAEERQKVASIPELFVDLGLPADTVRAEVRVGDPVTLRQPFADLGEVVTGKALDDRASCWALVEALRRLERPRNHVYAVFSVQEEVGLRGARTGAFGLEPDVGIALDTTPAVDTPGAPADQAVSRLGEGVALKVMDGRSISTRWLLDEFVELAEARGVPHQLEVLTAGGTDAGAIQQARAGVPSVTLSIPSRYVHTVTEMVAKRDLEATVTLLLAYLEG